MSPLDLTVAPPRSPRADTLGIIFFPRSIDKLRAHLPGGKPGVYTLPGFTQALLTGFGVTTEHALSLVAAASDDEEVAAAVLRDAPPGAFENWNGFISKREPRGGNREEALKAYPWLAERPDLVYSLDVLAEDDQRSFA